MTVATSHDVWRNGPEKALAMREAFAQANPQAARGVLRALYRAGQFCDGPENASYVASLLARRAWLALDSHAILSSLPGTQGARATSRFSAEAANYPWRSQALWFLTQMTAARLLPAGLDLRAIAARLYRPDLYAAALGEAGAPVPEEDMKAEGAHGEPWLLPARPAPIAMAPDLFCDGAVFDPSTVP